MSSIEVSEEEGVRYLHFGTHWIQGAMRIARPWSLVLEYTRDMMYPLLLAPDAAWPRSVLVIGLGAASIPRFLYRHFPRAAQTIVECDPKVVDVARASFRLPEERPRFRIEIGDGADYVIASDRRFDWIIVDGFDGHGRPGTLDTLPFYCNCVARLADRGVVSLNLLTWRHGLRGGLARLTAAFGKHLNALPPCESGNVVAVASGGAAVTATREALKDAAARLKAKTRLDLAPLVTRIDRRARSV
jgi:spermidine synthase